MNAPCTSRYPAQIDKLLVGGLSERKLQRLREHLQGCPACQQRYNKIVLASRLFEGGPRALTVPSEGELERVGLEVMRRVRLVPDAQPARRWLLSGAAAVATCGVVLAIALPLALRQVGPPASPGGGPVVESSQGTTAGAGGGVEEHLSGLQPRGPRPGSGPGSVAPRLGLRAFCIRKSEGAPVVTSLAPTGEAGDPASCGIGDVLKLAFTNNRSELGYLFVVGLDEKHLLKWYEPHPPRRQSIKVPGDAVDEPLSRAVRLAVNHRPGQLRLFALFSARPLTAEQIEAAAARVRQSRTPLERLAELPLPGTRQQSVLLRLEP